MAYYIENLRSFGWRCTIN